MSLFLHDLDGLLEETILVAEDLSDLDDFNTPQLLKLLAEKAAIFNRDYGGAIKEILQKNSAGFGVIDNNSSARWWVAGKSDRSDDFVQSAHVLGLGCTMFWNEQPFWMANHYTDGDIDFPMYFYRSAAHIAVKSDVKRGVAVNVFPMDGDNDFCASFARNVIDPNIVTEIDKNALDGMLDLAAEMTVIAKKLVELNVSPERNKRVLYRPADGWALTGF